ncbi:MAG: hypothetical protein ACYCUC_15830 [Candidatus Dormibacteria bacterium]
MAVAGLVAIAKSEGAAIAHEDLDFSRSRAGPRYLPHRLARLLSSFAYNQLLTTLASRCASYGVRHVPVNPAWTSVLGQANYAGVHCQGTGGTDQWRPPNLTTGGHGN